MFVCAILPPPFPFTSVLMAAGIMQYPRRKFFLRLDGRAWRALLCRGMAGQDLWPANDQFPRTELQAGNVLSDRAGRGHRDQYTRRTSVGIGHGTIKSTRSCAQSHREPLNACSD